MELYIYKNLRNGKYLHEDLFKDSKDVKDVEKATKYSEAIVAIYHSENKRAKVLCKYKKVFYKQESRKQKLIRLKMS